MVRSHDQEFSEFAVEHRDALLRTAFLLTGDAGLAEDLVQTALVKADLAWGRIRSRDAAGAYTRRIMVTTAISWRRRRWWRAERPKARGAAETGQGIELLDGSASDLGHLVTERAWVWDAVQSVQAADTAVIASPWADAERLHVGTLSVPRPPALRALFRSAMAPRGPGMTNSGSPC